LAKKFKIMKFGPSLESNGLGDTLLFTSICKYEPIKYTIQLPFNKKHFKILFKGLANIEITDNPILLKDIGDGHWATQKLRYIYGEYADLLDNRPLVLYSDQESEIWAQNLINNIKNPIIFVPHCSLRWHSVRSFSSEKANSMISHLLSLNYTPIICSTNSNPFPHINTCVNLLNIDLNKYICLLRKVGNYIGCNTGDMHLAIGVGAITKVFQPKSNSDFNEFNWNYYHPTIEYYLL